MFRVASWPLRFQEVWQISLSKPVAVQKTFLYQRLLHRVSFVRSGEGQELKPIAWAQP